ncbi:magnesium/cobalt transporter CorA [Yeosuana sp. MJ-SS3]|uniref:Magnesium transport protein CorA n=1 Tax=Gilvirhabdus luticola TaxID=3079858 RepID=A0ABU3U8Y0_9FLAO|nr:magnesium/cobalt transporter CorA [Yeosuana sp. MJ-SS3]MDU8886867.1 magnesium/cobalt transporter CorA [Yeosuana sp. MJ-SS3]
MARFIRKEKHEIGLSPDELLFRGEKKVEEVTIRVIDFDAKNLEENALKEIAEIQKYQEKKTVTWLNIDGLHNSTLMQEIARVFKLDDLVLANVMNTTARPTVFEHDNCISISVKMLQLNENTGLVSVENLSLILTKSVLISFQEKRGDVFEPIRERIRKKKKRIRNGWTDYLAFALLDIVIDNYIYIIGVLGEKIEILEENLGHDQPSKSIIKKINTYKRELNFIRRNIRPAKEMILSLSKMESEFIFESTYVHYKELLDNINQANDSTDSYREILTDQLNLYHTTISSKLNDIMKFLTIFSVIFIPLTFIAGIYGTNFEVLPELQYKYSYFIMLAAMLVLAIGMLIYFRKRKWF